MKCRLKSDIRITAVNDDGQMTHHTIHKGTVGRVTNFSSYSNGPDEELEEYFEVFWDGFVAPRMQKIFISRKKLDFGFECNKKGWKV